MILWYCILISGFFTSTLAKSVSLKAEKQPFTLEEAVLEVFKQNQLSGAWISDTELEYRDPVSGDINILDASTLKIKQFVPNSVIEKYHGVSYNVSADRKFMFIKYDSKMNYRRSSFAKYVVYSISDKTYYNISNGQLIQSVQWAPVGNALAYVMNNNLYYLPKITSTMKSQAITTDGIPGLVFNGASDWVYEEEVLLTDKAYYFSPKGDQMIYVKFIDTSVGELKFMTFGNPGDYSRLYPKENKVRFPKVGTPNPRYQVWWVDLTNVKNQRLMQNYTKDQPQREVFYGNRWVNNEVTTIVYSNRVQNESEIVVYAFKVNETAVMYRSKNSRGWANTEIPKYSENPNRMIKINAQPVGNDEFDHLELILEKSNYVLTNGTFEVIEFLDWDRKNKVIYYRATEENSPSTIQVYRISEAKGSKPYCMSCKIKSPEGRDCKHATAVFSKNFSYVVIQCNGPDPPMTYLYKNEYPLKSSICVLDNNAALRAALRNKLMPQVMNFTVPIPGPFKAEVRLYLPPNMDYSGKTKYPMLLYTYGGINSKRVYDNFKIDLELYWPTNRSVIYAVVDARNTKNKGKNMLYAGYTRIGTIEMEDQITVTKYLHKTYSFIDAKRTGVWGWSFGGYSTLRILQLDKDRVFKCGVAVSPAVDFVLYDTMFSERYMKSFKENREGYLKASVLTDVKKLKGRNFLVITGNADDNLHYQQPMLLTRALELNDIMFEALSYPDEAHGLFGVRPHFYHSMDEYWRKCFNI